MNASLTLHRKTNLRLLTRRPMLFARCYWWQLLVLLVGATLDAATTMIMMYRYGPEIELHTAMYIVVSVLGITLGVPLGTLVKLAFAVFVAAVFRGWCGWMLVLCGLLYALGAMNNHFMWL